jgi:hypothetical protein
MLLFIYFMEVMILTLNSIIPSPWVPQSHVWCQESAGLVCFQSCSYLGMVGERQYGCRDGSEAQLRGALLFGV